MVEERFRPYDAVAGAPTDPLPDRVGDPGEFRSEEFCRLLVRRAGPDF